MRRVIFKNEQVTVETETGANLLALMQEHGIAIDAPCGGNGKCGKCLVQIVDTAGNVQTRKACKTTVAEDMTVMTQVSGQGAVVLTEGLRADQSWVPSVLEEEILVPPCPNGKSISDWTRLCEELAKHGMKKHPQPDPELASLISERRKAVEGRFFVIHDDSQIYQVSTEEEKIYLAGFDIGTTTVAGYLINAKTGEQEAVSSRLNPQFRYGADVINRANYTLQNGTRELTECIRGAVNEMLAEMTERVGANSRDVYTVCVVGNTCMHHLFLGISTESLVHAPYNPAIQEGMTLRCSAYGICAGRKAELIMLPNIAGFVGADTVACLVSTRLAEEKDWTLLIDIGTNGEMVLGKDHKMAACSTAAGPALEGAGIAHGMRGSTGALSHASYGEDGWAFETIGDAPMVGICGSGLLDLLSELLRSGQMDETGALEAGDQLVLADAEHSGNGECITLEQKDIRQIQLAKAAIASGVHLLAKKQGIRVDEIAQVWLAGAFGSFMSPESACRIGLIPQELDGKICAVGNAAGAGAVAVLRNRANADYAQQVAAEAEFLELAGMPEFQDRFVDELLFPENEDE